MGEAIDTDTGDEKVYRGVVDRVTYYNPESGYSVLQLTLAERGGKLTVVGTCPGITAGTSVVVRGVFKQHSKYGRQLEARSITESVPSSADGIERYLASGVIKGIGPKTAEKLVATFGDKTLEILFQNPNQIARVPGIGKHKVELLQEALLEHREVQEIMRFLLEHNITQGLAKKIHERYGNRSIEVLNQDPYLLARDLYGVGFATADRIAMNLGLKPDAPQRLKAGLYYALEKASDDGHCYLPVNLLVDKTQVLLGISVDQGIDLQAPLHALLEEGFIIEDEECFYLRHLYRAEEFIAKFIADRCAPRPHPDIRKDLVETSLDIAEKELKLTFSPEQREAVLRATQFRLLVITGGPGCGKTTLIRALSALYRIAGKRLSLAAPTGRASQRMAQVCDMPASTIHRLLRYDPLSRHFVHGPNDPLPIDALIVDESSMIDVLLARDLFSALAKDATVILVGDKDQLPSVGPGRVFADLIALPEVQTVSLSRLFRRKEESAISSIAHMINSGVIPEIPEPDGATKTDAYFIPRSDALEAAKTVELLVSDQLPRKFGFSLTDIMVLTPSNRGDLGAEKLNLRLQERLNPSQGPDQELPAGGSVLRLNDRVCQRVNNYQIDDIGVFNGDLGTVYSVDRQAQSLTVELWDGRLIRYSPAELGQLSLAYTVTVHRSQGSEIPCVVLVLHDSHYTLLERQLIYTGVTRAKKLLVVVGSKRALAIATKRLNTHRRLSRLGVRVQRLL